MAHALACERRPTHAGASTYVSVEDAPFAFGETIRVLDDLGVRVERGVHENAERNMNFFETRHVDDKVIHGVSGNVICRVGANVIRRDGLNRRVRLMYVFGRDVFGRDVFGRDVLDWFFGKGPFELVDTAMIFEIFEGVPQMGRFGRRRNHRPPLFVRAKAKHADETQSAQHEQSTFRSHAI
jgi:hypothetical protein